MADEMNVKIPFFKSIIYPFNLVIEKFFTFSGLALVVVFFELGCSFLFSSGEVLRNVFYLFEGFLLVYFINRFYLIIEENKSLKEVLCVLPDKKDVKISLVIFLFFLLLLCLTFAIMQLYQRKATADYVFELGYFFFWSFVIVFLVFLFFYSVLFYRFLQGKPLSFSKNLLGNVLDNIYVDIFGFFFYVLFLFMCYISVEGNIRVGVENVLLKNVLLFIVAKYFFYLGVAFYLSGLKYREKILFKD